MSDFVLLLRGGDFQKYSPEEMQAIVEKYIKWGDQLREQGRYKGGNELKETGRILSRRDDRVLDGPFAETKESVGGFFVIEASDYEEAVRIAKDCPHLLFGGEVELREVNPH